MDDLKDRLKSGKIYSAARSAAKIIVKGVGDTDTKQKFQDLYRDSYSEVNFREWLALIIDGAELMPDGYSSSEVRTSVGFMTYTFLKLSTVHKKWESTGRHSTSFDQAREFMDRENIADKVIQTQSLESDVHDLLSSAGHKVAMEDLITSTKDNASAHKEYKYYYDEGSFLRIQRAERMLVDRFMYSF